MSKNIKNRKKKNFIELDTKGNVVLYENNTNSKKISKIKNACEIETPLKILSREFPNTATELIEMLLDENMRDIIATRSNLITLNEERVIPKKQDSSNKSSNNNESEDNSKNKYSYNKDSINTGKTNASSRERNNEDYDINAYNDEDLNKYISLICFSDEENNNEDYDENRENQYKIPLHCLRLKVKKSNTSCITLTNNNENRKTPDFKNNSNSSFLKINEPFYNRILEESNLNFYVNSIKECFPCKSETEIIQDICDEDYNIENVLSKHLEKDLSKNNEKKEEVNINEFDYFDFYPNERLFFENFKDIEIDDKTISMQEDILKEIKKEQFNNRINDKLFNEDEFPVLKNTNSNSSKKNNGIKEDDYNNEDDHEYFLDKQIYEIKNKKIRDDLKKLCKRFPFESEDTIKLVYYQYMNYDRSVKALNKLGNNVEVNVSKLDNVLDKKKPYGMTTKIYSNSNDSYGIKAQFNTNLNNSNNINNNSNNSNSTGNNKVKENEFVVVCNNNKKCRENNSVINKSNPYKVINSQNKMYIEEGISNKSLSIANINKYRQQLLSNINSSVLSGNYSQVQRSIAQSKAFKQQILNLMKQRELIIDCAGFNNYDKIDLHGFTLNESKILLKKRISFIRSEYNSGNIRACESILTIVTGIGKHSKNGWVLFPNLKSWLETDYSSLRKKYDSDHGIIRVKCV